MTTLDTYTPSKNYANDLKNVSDERVDMAEEIIKSRADKNWDQENFGFNVIGVTGSKQVYYTLWSYRPKNMINQMVYLGNLSTDIVEAAKKAVKVSGIKPIYFEQYETLKGMAGAPADVITFGKYRGKTIGEIYTENPQYVIWLSKNMSPRNQKQVALHNMARELTDDYFRCMTEKNQEKETMEYYGETGEKVEAEMKLTFAKLDAYYTGYEQSWESPAYVKMRAELDGKYRFEFFINSIDKLSRMLNCENSKDLGSKLDEFVCNESTLLVKAKVKRHKEVVGKKYTQLNYVKLSVK